MEHNINFYTDGSCSTKIRSGGWGCVSVCRDTEKPNVSLDYGSEEDTTNNRMELTGFLKALRKIEHTIPFNKEKSNFTIYSDSAYIVNCFKQKWYKKWQANGWKTSNRTVVKNEDLWKEIIHAYDRIKRDPCFTLTIEKVKGHIGNKYNEMADMCANKWRER